MSPLLGPSGYHNKRGLVMDRHSRAATWDTQAPQALILEKLQRRCWDQTGLGSPRYGTLCTRTFSGRRSVEPTGARGGGGGPSRRGARSLSPAAAAVLATVGRLSRPLRPCPQSCRYSTVASTSAGTWCSPN